MSLDTHYVRRGDREREIQSDRKTEREKRTGRQRQLLRDRMKTEEVKPSFAIYSARDQSAMLRLGFSASLKTTSRGQSFDLVEASSLAVKKNVQLTPQKISCQSPPLTIQYVTIQKLPEATHVSCPYRLFALINSLNPYLLQSRVFPCFIFQSRKPHLVNVRYSVYSNCKDNKYFIRMICHCYISAAWLQHGHLVANITS